MFGLTTQQQQQQQQLEQQKQQQEQEKLCKGKITKSTEDNYNESSNTVFKPDFLGTFFKVKKYITTTSNAITVDYYKSKYAIMKRLFDDSTESLYQDGATIQLMKNYLIYSLTKVGMCKDNEKMRKLALNEAVFVGKIFLKMSYSFQNDGAFLNAVVEIIGQLMPYGVFKCGVFGIKQLYFYMVSAFLCAVNPNAKFVERIKPKSVGQMEDEIKYKYVDNRVMLNGDITGKIKNYSILEFAANINNPEGVMTNPSFGWNELILFAKEPLLYKYPELKPATEALNYYNSMYIRGSNSSYCYDFIDFLTAFYSKCDKAFIDYLFSEDIQFERFLSAFVKTMCDKQKSASFDNDYKYFSMMFKFLGALATTERNSEFILSLINSSNSLSWYKILLMLDSEVKRWQDVDNLALTEAINPIYCDTINFVAAVNKHLKVNLSKNVDTPEMGFVQTLYKIILIPVDRTVKAAATRALSTFCTNPEDVDVIWTLLEKSPMFPLYDNSGVQYKKQPSTQTTFDSFSMFAAGNGSGRGSNSSKDSICTEFEEVEVNGGTYPYIEGFVKLALKLTKNTPYKRKFKTFDIGNGNRTNISNSLYYFIRNFVFAPLSDKKQRPYANENERLYLYTLCLRYFNVFLSKALPPDELRVYEFSYSHLKSMDYVCEGHLWRDRIINLLIDFCENGDISKKILSLVVDFASIPDTKRGLSYDPSTVLASEKCLLVCLEMLNSAQIIIENLNSAKASQASGSGGAKEMPRNEAEKLKYQKDKQEFDKQIEGIRKQITMESFLNSFTSVSTGEKCVSAISNFVGLECTTTDPASLTNRVITLAAQILAALSKRLQILSCMLTSKEAQWNFGKALNSCLINVFFFSEDGSSSGASTVSSTPQCTVLEMLSTSLGDPENRLVETALEWSKGGVAEVILKSLSELDVIEHSPRFANLGFQLVYLMLRSERLALRAYELCRKRGFFTSIIRSNMLLTLIRSGNQHDLYIAVGWFFMALAAYIRISVTVPTLSRATAKELMILLFGPPSMADSENSSYAELQNPSQFPVMMFFREMRGNLCEICRTDNRLDLNINLVHAFNGWRFVIEVAFFSAYRYVPKACRERLTHMLFHEILRSFVFRGNCARVLCLNDIAAEDIYRAKEDIFIELNTILSSCLVPISAIFGSSQLISAKTAATAAAGGASSLPRQRSSYMSREIFEDDFENESFEDSSISSILHGIIEAIILSKTTYGSVSSSSSSSSDAAESSLSAQDTPYSSLLPHGDLYNVRGNLYLALISLMKSSVLHSGSFDTEIAEAISENKRHFFPILWGDLIFSSSLQSHSTSYISPATSTSAASTSSLFSGTSTIASGTSSSSSTESFFSPLGSGLSFQQPSTAGSSSSGSKNGSQYSENSLLAQSKIKIWSSVATALMELVLEFALRRKDEQWFSYINDQTMLKCVVEQCCSSLVALFAGDDTRALQEAYFAQMSFLGLVARIPEAATNLLFIEFVSCFSRTLSALNFGSKGISKASLVTPVLKVIYIMCKTLPRSDDLSLRLLDFVRANHKTMSLLLSVSVQKGSNTDFVNMTVNLFTMALRINVAPSFARPPEREDASMFSELRSELGETLSSIVENGYAPPAPPAGKVATRSLWMTTRFTWEFQSGKTVPKASEVNDYFHVVHCCTSIISLLTSTDVSLRSGEALRVVVAYLRLALRSWSAWSSYAAISPREFQAFFAGRMGDTESACSDDCVQGAVAFRNGAESIVSVLGTSVELALLFVKMHIELYTKACNEASASTASFFSPIDPTKKLIGSVAAEFKASSPSSLPIVDYLKQLKASRNSQSLDRLVASLDELLFSK